MGALVLTTRCHRCGVSFAHGPDGDPPEWCSLCVALYSEEVSPNTRTNTFAAQAFPRGYCERCRRVPTTQCMQALCPTYAVGQRSYGREWYSMTPAERYGTVVRQLQEAT